MDAVSAAAVFGLSAGALFFAVMMWPRVQAAFEPSVSAAADARAERLAREHVRAVLEELMSSGELGDASNVPSVPTDRTEDTPRTPQDGGKIGQDELLTKYQALRAMGLTREQGKTICTLAGWPMNNGLWAKAAPAQGQPVAVDQELVLTPKEVSGFVVSRVDVPRSDELRELHQS